MRLAAPAPLLALSTAPLAAVVLTPAARTAQLRVSDMALDSARWGGGTLAGVSIKSLSLMTVRCGARCPCA